MRLHYRNGDAIDLTTIGCDGCNPSMINGILCHERGCPEQWRDNKRECVWCGSSFYPESRDAKFCDIDCYKTYYDRE